MSIDITDVIRTENVTRPFGDTPDISSISYDRGDFRIVRPIEIEGTLVMMDGKLFMKGGILVTLERVCDRCGEGYTRSYELVIDEVINRDDQDDGQEGYSFQGESLDPTRLIEDCIVLQVPTASLCSEDCKGLCPVCGANRNVAECDHGDEIVSSPFSALAGLADLKKEE